MNERTRFSLDIIGKEQAYNLGELYEGYVGGNHGEPLDGEVEQALTKIMAAGRAAEQQAAHDDSDLAPHEYSAALREAAKARDVLYYSNLGRVDTIAKWFAPHIPATIEMDDLIAVGRAELMRSINVFDTTFNSSFHQFFRWNVHNKMLEWIGRTNRIIYIKKHAVERAIQFRNLINEGHTQEEAAASVGYRLETLLATEVTLTKPDVYLYDELADDSFNPLIEFFDGPESRIPLDEQVCDVVLAKDAMRAVCRLVRKRDIRARDPDRVLKILFDKILTRKLDTEIGQEWGVTRQRVSQLYLRAEELLRRDGMSQPAIAQWIAERGLNDDTT